MKLHIRKEKEEDFSAIKNLIVNAFETMLESDHKEQFLVERLRKSEHYIPQLALVAELNQQIVGYVLVTKIKIINKNRSYDTLALAPLAVLPEYQCQGIGNQLMQEVHKIATTLGYGSIVILGHPSYYPKFGYKQTHEFGIKFPFDVPQECCMIIELYKDALKNINGTVEYSKEFFEE